MKLRVLGFAGVAAALLVLTACSSSPASGGSANGSASSKAPAGLIQAGTLTACIDPEYAPLEYYADATGGEIIGFDADGIRAVAKHWGVEPTFEVTSFDGLMPATAIRQSCDIIFGGLYMSEARLAIADAAPVHERRSRRVVADPPLAAKLAQARGPLCGLTVATQAASSELGDVDRAEREVRRRRQEADHAQRVPQDRRDRAGRAQRQRRRPRRDERRRRLHGHAERGQARGR